MIVLTSELRATMSAEGSQDSTQSKYRLQATLDNARNLASLLKTIHFKDTATVFVSENGLKFSVEDSKCVQGNAFIQASLFSAYNVTEDNIVFRINLTVLLDCLNIFGTSSTVAGGTAALKLCQTTDGAPLSLMLEEAGVLTDCSLRTQAADDTLDFSFASHNVVNKVIMKSESMREAFAELDLSSEVLEVLLAPDKPHLRLSTFGPSGDSHWECPKDSDVVESFQCNARQINRYKVSLLKPSVKALALASRVSLRTDARGFLSLQYMVRLEDGQVSFLEYFCAPDEDVEDELLR